MTVDFVDLVYQAIPGLKESSVGSLELKDYPMLKYVINNGEESLPGMMPLPFSS